MLKSPTLTLLKYDLKATSRLIIPLTVISIILGLISRILLGISTNNATSSFNSEFPTIYALTGIAIMMVIFMLIILSVVIFWVIVTNFWNTLFSDEGYLYHTLPVKPAELLLSKLLCANIWQFLMVFVMLIFVIGGLSLIPKNELVFLIDNVKTGFSQINTDDGFKIAIISILYVLLAFLNVNMQYLTIFMSMATGQLVNEHKKLVSFGCYIGITIVIQTITQILTSGFIAYYNTESTYNNISDLMIYPQILLIISLAICLCLFMGTGYIFKNKLNLE